jgi:DNA (cytosine-5)-methyltransferase 1
MKHGSLFSGIGGFDLAAEWMGWTNVFHCEMNPFGQRVLAHHFPNSKLHEDVTTFPSADYAGRIDILSGGFPCQPYSVAGNRQGKDDERHLWPAMLDVIRAVRPRWVVGENVRGLVNWNGGLVFEEVCADLEDSGYSVQPYLLPAAAVGAPHRRDRIWFVAHANDERAGARFGQVQGANGEVPERDDDAELGDAGVGVAAYANDARAEQPLRDNGNGTQGDEGRKKQPLVELGQGGGIATNTNDRRAGREIQAGRDEPAGGYWAGFPTQPPICGGNDGLPRELDGITFPKWRAESIKAYGNAIVPQVALQIFKAIQAFENDQ